MREGRRRLRNAREAVRPIASTDADGLPVPEQPTRTRRSAAAMWFACVAGLLLIALSALGCSSSKKADPEGTSASAKPLVTADSECAGVPSLSEVARSQVGSDKRNTNMTLVSLCNPGGDIRPLWPDGITADAALAYERRVCEGSGVAPPAPQDWYASHPGSSNEVDDFAAAVADLGLYYRSNLSSGPVGVRSCP